MKKVYLHLIVLLSICFWSCSNENIVDIEEESFTPFSIETNVDEIDISGISEDAALYFSNLRTVVFATESNVLPTPSLRSSDVENPFIEKLQDLTIVDPDTQKEVSFFSMSEAEQAEFLEKWSIAGASQMSEKIAVNSDVAVYVREQNQIVTNLIKTEFEPTATLRSSGVNLKVKDKNAFFSKLKEQMEAQSIAYEENNDDQVSLRSSIASEDLIPVNNVKNALNGTARRGDFMLALPKHNRPWAFINLAHDRYKVGHAGILTTNVYSSTENDAEISLGAWTGDGVKVETMGNWSVRCYVMGIQNVKWVWKWKGFKSGLYKQRTAVSNPAALATWAEKYKKRPYVNWYEFATAKWAAPSRFTCTTLVWWCSKEAYDINVSEWWATMVSPSGLYLDESTYVRKEVK